MTNRAERVREAFEDVPRIDDPDAVQRHAANNRYPDEVVPDDGPVPDPHHAYRATPTIEVPDWVVFAVQEMLQSYDNPDEDTVQDLLFEVVQDYPDYVTKHGHDVFDVVLGRVGRDPNGGDEGDD